MKAQAPKSVNILSRDVIALTGVILYTILSSNGLDKYFATVKDGKVFCECKGFEYRGTCRHAQYIEQCELVASFDIHSAVDEIVESVEAATLDQFYAERGAEMAPAGIEKFFVENRTPTYGTCGHISKNPDDECPACRSRWYR